MATLRAYEAFMLENAAQISSLESGLRSLTYFLPGRFTDADLASEGIFSFVNLVGLYNNRILHKAAVRACIPIKPSAHNRYTRMITESSTLMAVLANLLSVAALTESFIEMAVTKQVNENNRKKWNTILIIELAKALAKLTLLLKTSRTIPCPPLPTRDVDPETIQQATVHQNTTTYTHSAHITVHGHSRGPHSGKLLPALKVFGEGVSVEGGFHDLWGGASTCDTDWTTQYMESKALTKAVKFPRDLMSVLRSVRFLGEILFIIRPVLYVRKLGRDKWFPWIASLTLELTSWTMYSGNLASMLSYLKCPVPASLSTSSPTPLEREEHRRRLKLTLANGLKDPFYNYFTKSILDSFCDAVGEKFFLRMFSGIIRNYQPLWEHVYFYTSGS